MIFGTASRKLPLLATAALVAISLTACASRGTSVKPPSDPVKDQVESLALKACAAPADLMAPVIAEPEVPTPRDPVVGLQPDEMFVYSQALAEWGTRGWATVLGWQNRERALGPCVKTQ